MRVGSIWNFFLSENPLLKLLSSLTLWPVSMEPGLPKDFAKDVMQTSDLHFLQKNVREIRFECRLLAFENSFSLKPTAKSFVQPLF